MKAGIVVLPTAFEALRLGWERYQTSDARALWIDDVVVAPNPVGCPTP